MSKAKLTLVRDGVDRSRTAPHDRLTSGGNDGGDMLESRVARLESDVSHIRLDIEHIKSDIRDMRHDIRDVRKDMQSDFRMLFGCIIAVALGLAGLMAKGFHWL